MARRSKDVTDAELDLLRVLWDQGECTVRQVAETLYGSAGNSDCATVQKLGERLADKRLASMDRRRRPLQMKARVDRYSLIGRRLKTVAEDLASGSFAPLVSHLLRDGRFTTQELAALRQELDGSNIHVCCVHPGGIKTNIARDSRGGDAALGAEERDNEFQKLARTTAESAAAQMIQAIEKRKKRLLIGADAKYISLISRLFPVRYPALLPGVAKPQSTAGQ